VVPGAGEGEAAGEGDGATATQAAGWMMVSLISATWPLRARALPVSVTPLFMVMSVSAMIVPIKVVVVSRVAELPTSQKTWHG
jgi:hypothetical protein